MLDLLRLYLVNILRPVFEDPQLIQDELLSDTDDRQSNQATSGDEDDEDDQLDGRSQALSFNGSDLTGANAVRQRKKGARALQVGAPTTKRRSNKSAKKRRSLSDLGLLDSSGPKLIHGIRSWLVMFQVVGQINWLGVPFYLALIYKISLFALVGYVYFDHFIKPQMNSNIVDSNYRNPIFIFIGALAIVTTLVHAAVTIYSNLFNLCPLFKVLTTPRLCFIKREVQHIVGSKFLFFMLIFQCYQCALTQMLGLKDLNEFFNQFHVGKFILDSFVTACVCFFNVGIIQIDFYIRICFGFWIVAMKTNLEYRSAYLQRHNRINRIISSSAANNSRQLAGRQSNQRAKSITTSVSSYLKLEPQTQQSAPRQQVDEANLDDQAKLAGFAELDAATSNEDVRSTNSLETTTTINTAIINYNNKQRSTTAQSTEQATLNSFKDKYKLDTMDEIQKNLNTMDDHLEVCRGIQNGSLVLITLNAFLSNGAILLLAYNLLANQGKYFHGVIMVLLAFNNTLLVFLCYIGDSWISYALGSFAQTVEDEYFLQGGDDCTSVRQPAPQQQQEQQQQSKNGTLASNNDPVLPLNWSIIRMNETSDAGSETAPSVAPLKSDGSLFLIKKKDVLFCREFLHQFENHLATPWSKLTVKIHLHMLGTFVTLIAAQIIFDREH